MVKIISLSEAAYKELKKVKGKYSFSETVLAILKPKKADLLNVFGKWPGPKGELNKIENIISKERKNFKIKEVSI